MVRRIFLRAVIAALAAAGLALTATLADAQVGATAIGDPLRELKNSILTVRVNDHSISGVVTHLRELSSFKYGIALFPGYPSIMKVREEDGQPKFELAGNFLVRSRRHWLDAETMVIAVDAPSDQWTSFSQWFRQDPRYGADVAALLTEASRRYAVKDWTLVGTSEGSVSAFHAARMNPGLARRLVLTSSLFLAAGHGPGLSGVNWEDLTAQLLWVHHEEDSCPYTPYSSARRHADMTRAPLLTVRGGTAPRGAPCEAFSQHGYIGIERETVLAIRTWVKTGGTPVVVTPP